MSSPLTSHAHLLNGLCFRCQISGDHAAKLTGHPTGFEQTTNNGNFHSSVVSPWNNITGLPGKESDRKASGVCGFFFFFPALETTAASKVQGIFLIKDEAAMR